MIEGSHLFPSMRATVRRRNSLPGRPLTTGLMFLSRKTKSRASTITFCVTCVVDKIVVTHFRKPVVGAASGRRGVSGVVVVASPSSTRRSKTDDSNQKRQVACQVAGAQESAPSPRTADGTLKLTRAANSARLPLLLLMVPGICNDGAMALLDELWRRRALSAATCSDASARRFGLEVRIELRRVSPPLYAGGRPTTPTETIFAKLDGA